MSGLIETLKTPFQEPELVALINLKRRSPFHTEADHGYDQTGRSSSFDIETSVFLIMIVSKSTRGDVGKIIPDHG